MKEMVFQIAKKVFLQSEKSHYHHFLFELDEPQRTQDNLLNVLLDRLNDSEYGQNIGPIKNYEEFSQKVPLIEYEDIESLVCLMLEGHKDLLFPGEAKLFERTSGSSSKEKYIPYPKELVDDFTAMFRLWAYDVLNFGPDFKYGTFYFSISPQFNDKRESSGGAQINLEDDSQYLNGLVRWLVSPFMAVDNSIKKIKDPELFKSTLLECLKEKKDLEIISVWNPSFLTTLLEGLSSKELQDHFSNVKFISCWGSNLASYDFKKIKQMFPNAHVQAKGLLSTEAPMTLPLFNAPAPVPLAHLVFFEFIDENDTILRLHELEEGQTYEIIITQKGGLYRYKIGDRVRVQGFYKNTPCLEFVGRNDVTSDLVGEKISESYLESYFKQKCQKQLSVVIPSKQQSRYFLICEGCDDPKSFENYLMKSYHYQNARKLGQLKPAKYICVSNLSQKILDYFEREKKMNRGDIKFRRLYSAEWDDRMLEWIQDLSER